MLCIRDGFHYPFEPQNWEDLIPISSRLIIEEKERIYHGHCFGSDSVKETIPGSLIKISYEISCRRKEIPNLMKIKNVCIFGFLWRCTNILFGHANIHSSLIDQSYEREL